MAQNHDYVRLRAQLMETLSKWSFVRGSREDVVDQSLERLWLKLDQGEAVTNIEHWLLATAKVVRKELERSCDTQSLDACSDPTCEFGPSEESDSLAHAPEFHLSQSQALSSLSDDQRFILRESIMFGRSVTEAARERGINRSTAKSWVKRIPPQLASDAYFLRRLSVFQRLRFDSPN